MSYGQVNEIQKDVDQIWGFPKIRGPFFGSPCSKDHNLLGSILGLPIYGSPHMRISAGAPIESVYTVQYPSFPP